MRISGSHQRNTRGRPVGTFQLPPILPSGRLFGAQSTFPRHRAIISRRGSQPLNTDPWNIECHTLTTLIPFRSSLPGTLSAPARTLDRAACQMGRSFPNGRVPLMRQISEGALKTYGLRSCAPLLDRWRQAFHRVASAHKWEFTRPPTYLGVVSTGCIVSAKAEKRSRLATEK